MTTQNINLQPRSYADRLITERPRCIWTTRFSPMSNTNNSWDRGLCGRSTRIGKGYTGVSSGTFLQAIRIVTDRGKLPYEGREVSFLGDICPACERICVAHFNATCKAAARRLRFPWQARTNGAPIRRTWSSTPFSATQDRDALRLQPTAPQR